MLKEILWLNEMFREGVLGIRGTFASPKVAFEKDQSRKEVFFPEEMDEEASGGGGEESERDDSFQRDGEVDFGSNENRGSNDDSSTVDFKVYEEARKEVDGSGFSDLSNLSDSQITGNQPSGLDQNVDSTFGDPNDPNFDASFYTQTSSGFEEFDDFHSPDAQDVSGDERTPNVTAEFNKSFDGFDVAESDMFPTPVRTPPVEDPADTPAEPPEDSVAQSNAGKAKQA